MPSKVREREWLDRLSFLRSSLGRVVLPLITLLVQGTVISSLASTIEKQHRELVEKAEKILLSGQSIDQAKAYLEQARRLVVKTPTGDFPFRSVKADYYYAWVLCREHNVGGYKLFDKILKNDSLNPELKQLVESQRDGCESGNSESRLVEVKQDMFGIHSEIQKGVEWTQPVYLRSRQNLPKVPIDPSAPNYPFLVTGHRTTSQYLRRLDTSVLIPYFKYFTQQMGLPRYEIEPIHVFVARTHSELARYTLSLYYVDNSIQDDLFLYDAIAYSDPEARMMAAICGQDPTNCTSFAHELFHVMNADSYEDAPWWLSEGMAELYESGNIVRRGGLEEFNAGVNWRKKYLPRESLSEEKLYRLLTLSANDPALNEPPGSAFEMAYARFFCQYLNAQGKLWDVYRTLRNRVWVDAVEDPSGSFMLQKELGKALGEIASDFQDWIARNVVPVQPRTQHP